jgi:predicted nucleic-acid-binding protein
MIGLDTNILVRHIMQDDPIQSPAASRLLGSLTAAGTGFVPLVAVIELNWVLSAGYNLDRSQIVQAFETLLSSRELVVEGAETVWKAQRLFARSKADFADCLVERSAAAAGCGRTITFDRGAAKFCGMALVE